MWTQRGLRGALARPLTRRAGKFRPTASRAGAMRSHIHSARPSPVGQEQAAPETFPASTSIPAAEAGAPGGVEGDTRVGVVDCFIQPLGPRHRDLGARSQRRDLFAAHGRAVRVRLLGGTRQDADDARLQHGANLPRGERTDAHGLGDPDEKLPDADCRIGRAEMPALRTCVCVCVYVCVTVRKPPLPPFVSRQRRRTLRAAIPAARWLPPPAKRPRRSFAGPRRAACAIGPSRPPPAWPLSGFATTRGVRMHSHRKRGPQQDLAVCLARPVLGDRKALTAPRRRGARQAPAPRLGGGPAGTAPARPVRPRQRQERQEGHRRCRPRPEPWPDPGWS